MRELIPESMTPAQLADVLRDMARRVELSDSHHGQIGYLPAAGTGPELQVWGTYGLGANIDRPGTRMIGHTPPRVVDVPLPGDPLGRLSSWPALLSECGADGA